MSDRKPCRKCLLADIKESDVYMQINKLLSLMPDSERADRDIYEKRLLICRECDELINATCNKCGCYVELRAAKKKEKCPSEKHFW